MKLKLFSVSFVLVSLLSGCTVTPFKDEKTNAHVLSIGRDGWLEDIQIPNKLFLKKSDVTDSKRKDYFSNILNGIKNFPKNKEGDIEVLIYIHGGLNTKNVARERVEDKVPLILNSKDKERKYPIFINWRSGATTYFSSVGRIRQGEISSTAVLTSPVYLLTDLANSVVNAPKSWLVTGEHSFDSVFLKDSSYLDEYASGKDGIYFTGNKNSYGSLGRSLWWIFTSPSKLITTPFVYTMAKPAWDIMLRRTSTPFLTPSDLANGNPSVKSESNRGTGALAEFLKELEFVIKDEKLPVKITLIGHSMGAIIVNKIIGENYDLPYKNIVHMASADSIENLFQKVIPYISKHDVKYYSLSLHPENEDREVSSWGLTPSGSLLVWVDEMYTTPQNVMNKRSGRWENIKRVLPFIPADARKKMNFKIFGLNNSGSEKDCNELLTEPQIHSDFGDLPFWKKRSWWQ